MSEAKKILVVGATGSQGGSVAKHLLKNPQFEVRCLTRNPESEAALQLKDAGAEVVKGDLTDTKSFIDSMKDCYGVFGVTNFFEHFDGELQQGKNLVDAVAASNIDHFIYSSLPHVNKLSNGEFVVPHFDIKGQIAEYAEEQGLNATFVHVAFYYENFLSYFPPAAQKDGTFAFGFPQGDTPLAGVCIEDLGGVVSAIFDRPADFKGITVGVVSEDIPPSKYAEIMTRVLGKMVVYNHIPREVFAQFEFPGANELAAMFDYNRQFIFERKDDLNETHALYPEIRSFESWVQENQEKFAPFLIKKRG